MNYYYSNCSFSSHNSLIKPVDTQHALESCISLFFNPPRPIHYLQNPGTNNYINIGNILKHMSRYTVLKNLSNNHRRTSHSSLFYYWTYRWLRRSHIIQNEKYKTLDCEISVNTTASWQFVILTMSFWLTLNPSRFNYHFTYATSKRICKVVDSDMIKHERRIRNSNWNWKFNKTSLHTMLLSSNQR